MVNDNLISRGCSPQKIEVVYSILPSSSVDSKGDSPLFSSSAISSHLRSLGYPEKSISSMNRCQENTGGYYYAYCDCGSSDGLHPMKHWCNLRTCPVCAKKRQRAVRRKYLKYLEQLSQTPLNSLHFLTISPRNYKSEKEGLCEIRKNYNKFLRLDYIKERIKGSLYVIETKQVWKGQEVFDKNGKFLYEAKEDSWNIHLHIIIYGRRLDNSIRGKCNCCNQNLLKFNYLTKEYCCASHRCNSKNVIVNQDSKLVTLWKKVSGDEDVNFHITKQIDRKTRQASPSFTLNYMLKYISATPEDFENEEGMARYIVATHKMKLIGTTGIFYKAKLKSSFPSVCRDCNSTINYLVSYELEPLKRRAEQEAEKLVWLRKNNSRKKEAPPPPPTITYVTLNNYLEGGLV